MDPDPANTDYYEYYMFEPEHVKKMFTKALDAKANVVRIEQFVKVWMVGEVRPLTNDQIFLVKDLEVVIKCLNV